ncbi:MAG: hypothetical protein QOG68_422 [Solirubrobacteraceae bacterium]|nr:hypothetical protein [Solirubrobacteraceae bacterium]
MSSPTVSVVMPVYNRADILSVAASSVLNQTYRDLELVVADDGSTDDTEAVVARLRAADPRVVYLQLEHHGITPTLNAGIAGAKGRYIARMDSDDICLPERLALQVELLESDSSIGVVGGQMRCTGMTGTRWWPATYPCDDAEIRSRLHQMNPFGHPAAMIRRQAFEAVGGYRTACLHAEDYDLWVRMLAGWKGANVSQQVLIYRVHPEQTAFRQWRQHCLSTMAVRAMARELRLGSPDPLADVDLVTERNLLELGIPAQTIRAELVESLLSLTYLAERIGCSRLREDLFRQAVELGDASLLPSQTHARVSLQSALFALERREPLRAARHLVRAVRADARASSGLARHWYSDIRARASTLVRRNRVLGALLQRLRPR